MIKFLLLALTFFAWSWSVDAHNYYNEAAWEKAGRHLKQFMNPKKMPCEEFFEHVCGNFLNESHNGFEHNLDHHTENVLEMLMQAIDKIDPKNEIRPIDKQLRKFYDQCLSGLQKTNETFRNNFTEAVKTAAEAALYSLIARENSTGNMNMFRFFGSLKRDLGADYPISFSSESYYTKRGSHFAVGYVHDNLNVSDMRTVPISDLPLLVPTFNWECYFDALLPTDVKRRIFEKNETVFVDVYEPELLVKFGTNISNTQLMTETIFEELKETLVKQIKDRISPRPDNNELCTEFSMLHLPSAMAKMFFKIINVESLILRQDITTVFRNLVSAFRFLLNNVDWMDPLDREKLQQKVDDIRFDPGIPTWIEDEKIVLEEITGYDYDRVLTIFENDFALLKIKNERQIRNAISKNRREPSPDFTANAFYTAFGNHIVLQLGLYTPPIYNVNYPLSLKYGGYGYVIGHELLHAFDTHHIHMPGTNQKEWISDQAMHEFQKRETCLITQYSKYCFPQEKKCVSGALTIGENIADIDGLKVAYAGYKFAEQVFGIDPPIQELFDYTHDQLFFTATARLWCARGLRRRWTEDVHTPEKPRIDVMMRNVPLFARAFRCPVGSYYAPLKACSIWGDLNNPARKR